jgi:sulfur carrier protein ThiS
LIASYLSGNNTLYRLLQKYGCARPEPCTLREFIATLGEDILYAFDRKVIGVLVNDRRLWPSAKLKPGDRVVVFPVIVGG